MSMYLLTFNRNIQYLNTESNLKIQTNRKKIMKDNQFDSMNMESNKRTPRK